MKTNSKIQEKRKQLKAISAPLRELYKIGEIHTINDGLRDIYARQGHEDLKTIRQWNKAGKQVKKGEKALLLWGSPKKYEVINADTSEVDEMDFYPICFVFSNRQVIESKKGGEK